MFGPIMHQERPSLHSNIILRRDNNNNVCTSGTLDSNSNQ